MIDEYKNMLKEFKYHEELLDESFPEFIKKVIIKILSNLIWLEYI